MDQRDFARELIFRCGGWWLLALSVVAVAGLVAGITVDIGWFIIGLMVFFIVTPLALAFLYYFYGLRKEFYVNTVPHRIIVDEEGITTVMRLSDPEDAGNPAEEGGDERPVRERKEFFSYSMMKDCLPGHGAFIVTFKKSSKGFIWFPITAFGAPDNVEFALDLIYNAILPPYVNPES